MDSFHKLLDMYPKYLVKSHKCKPLADKQYMQIQKRKRGVPSVKFITAF